MKTYYLILLSLLIVGSVFAIDANLSRPINNSILNDSYANLNVTVFDLALDNLTVLFIGDGAIINTSINATRNGTVSIFNHTWSGLAQGQHNWSVIVTNDTRTENSSQTNWTFFIDLGAPSIAYTNPTITVGNHSRNYTEVNISAADYIFLNFTAIYLYNSTGSIINSTNATTSPLIVNWTLSDGIYSINASANDSAGHINWTEARTFTLDTHAPSVEFTNPTLANGTNYRQNYTAVNITAVDAINLSHIVIYIYNRTGGLVNSSIGTVSPYIVNWSYLPDGLYSVNASANDTAGNRNWSATRTFRLDVTAPQIIFENPTPAEGNYSWNYTMINVSAFDAGLNMTNLTIRLYNRTGGLVNETNSTTSPLYVNYTNLPDGTYYFNATVNDTMNNMNFTVTRKIILDKKAPMITAAKVAPQTGAQGVAVNISANATDNMTGISLMYANVKRMNDSTLVVRLNMTVSSISWNATWSTTGADNITYYIDLVANDTANNVVTLYSAGIISLDVLANNSYSNNTVTMNDTNNDNNITYKWINTAFNVSVGFIANLTNSTINIISYNDDPFNGSYLGAPMFADITVSPDVVSNMTSAMVYIYYSDVELPTTLDESTLRLYYYNYTRRSWVQIGTLGEGGQTGVNTTGNYVWGNVTHFSPFGAFGSAGGGSAGGGAASTGGSGGSGGSSKICEAWQPCQPNGQQTRDCKLSPYSPTTTKETRDCTYVAQTEPKAPVAPAESGVTPKSTEPSAPEYTPTETYPEEQEVQRPIEPKKTSSYALVLALLVLIGVIGFAVWKWRE